MTGRLGSLFSGGGGLDMAVEAVFGARTVWQCEQDEAAAKVLAHRWPGVPNLGDITAVDWSAVEPVDVLCGGFPCFPAGTLIDAGEDGLRPIETLRVGDMVLTHERRRRAVTSVMRREADDVLVIKAMGAPDFRVTAEHPFYVLRGKNAMSPEWVAAGELRSGDYLAMPLDDAGAEPVLGPDVAYVVGRWLGDGWIVDHKRTSDIVGKRGSRVSSRVHKAIICCADSEAEDHLSAALLRAGLHATRADERTVVKFHISSASFVKTLRPFGRGAAGKRLPGWAFSLPQDERAALLQGWLDADGCRTQGQWKGATVSQELAHGMARLARSVHQRAVSVHRVRPPLTTTIEGREVNQRPWFQVVIPDRNKVAFVRDGFAWVPLRSVTEAPSCEVFNISVDEDESYTAWGYTVHNCQDVSSAGRRAGIKDGTRSGLWSYFAEAIDQLRPRFVVVENVRGLLSGYAHRAVESASRAVGDGSVHPVLRAAGAVLGDLADLGYDAQWVTVSAASVGAPHRRERVFILATDTTQCGAADLEVGGDPAGQHVGPIARASDRDRERSTAAGIPIVGRTAAVVATTTDADDTATDGEWECPQPWRGGQGLAADADGERSQIDQFAVRHEPQFTGTGLRGITLRAATADPACDGRHEGRPESARQLRGLDAAERGDGPVDLLPTPDYARMQREGSGGHDLVTAIAYHDVDAARWGKYGPAIQRWEALTRPAPSPTEPNTKGNPRLAAPFAEWMMGWPAGWVTDVPGISRNDMLRIIGNGVCPQQAVVALEWLVGVVAESLGVTA